MGRIEQVENEMGKGENQSRRERGKVGKDCDWKEEKKIETKSEGKLVQNREGDEEPKKGTRSWNNQLDKKQGMKK